MKRHPKKRQAKSGPPKQKKKPAASAGVEIAKPGSKRAKALELISREGGATLDQIVEATGSTRPSASNFVNELGAAVNIKRTRNADGALVYSRT